MSFELFAQELTTIIVAHILGRLPRPDQGLVHLVSLKRFALLRYKVSFGMSLFGTGEVDK